MSTQVRFSMWNGKTTYTVEFVFALSKWFIFNGNEYNNAVYSKKIRNAKFRDINKDAAEGILYEYLQS